MKSLVVLVFILFVSQAHAKDCRLSLDKSSVKLKWTAFKTTKKIGVSGSFKKNNWKMKAGKNIDELMKSIEFTIKTKSMDSGSWVRDRRVYKNFFKLMKNGEEIKGSGISYNKSDKKAVIEVDMNGERTPVVFNVEMKPDDSFVMKGSLDILKHFKMKKSYDSIAKLCEKLHTGADGISKTWTDVDLEVTGKIKKNCP